MTADDDATLTLPEPLDGGQRSANTRVVCHGVSAEWHIEVHAQENSIARAQAEVAESGGGHQDSSAARR